MTARRRWLSGAARAVPLWWGVALGCRDAQPPEPAPGPPRLPAPPGEPRELRVRPVEPRELCVSLGSLRPSTGGSHWVNTAAQFRATVPASAGDQARVSFRYLGHTVAKARLGSGQERRQIGLKLRAADTCNVVYVMWRFGPPSSVVVSVKGNPGQHHHVQCGNRGYRNLKPLWSAPVAEPAPESVHELSARIVGNTLEVSLDARPVLRAALEGERLPVRGQSGLRSDNVSFELLRFDVDRRPELVERSPRCRPWPSGFEGRG